MYVLNRISVHGQYIHNSMTGTIICIFMTQISEDEGFAGSLSRSASGDHLSPLDTSWEEQVSDEDDVWDLAIKAKPKTHYVWEQVGR